MSKIEFMPKYLTNKQMYVLLAITTVVTCALAVVLWSAFLEWFA